MSQQVLPQRFGRYCIERELGRGGMGVVYLAVDTELDRQVALKVPHFDDNPHHQVVERFRREARVAASIHHPNICPIYDIGEIEGIHYLTMPFLQGVPLSKQIDLEKPWPTDQAVRLVCKVAQALALMHSRSVIHRDLKPGNILVQPDGEPIIMDFGLARNFEETGQRMTGTGQAMGTPVYMAPEQVLGAYHKMGPATDVYALGVILFELLTGRVPFGGTLAAVYGQILHARAPRPSHLFPGVGPQADAICGKCLAKKPEQRYASMTDLTNALTDWLGQWEPAPSTVRPVPAPSQDTPALPQSDHPTARPQKTREVARPTLLRCPGCGKRLRAPTNPRAIRFKCPDCGTAIRRSGKKQADSTRPTRSQAPTQPPPESNTVPGPKPRGFGFRKWILLVAVSASLVLVGMLVWWTRPPYTRQQEPLPIEQVQGTRPQGQANEVKRITNSIGMELVLIPAGTFTMGSPAEDEGGRTDERPQHEVEITRPFYLGVHEVTQEQYEKVMGKNPSAFSVGGKHSDRAKGMVTKQFPVENVSWAEAVEFCKKLSHLPEESKAKRVYRLPSEAEWEYSCRGGSDSRDSYYFGATLTSKQANFNYTPGRTTKVGSYQPNAFDLHDMHGNVYEWCSDWYASDYYTNSPRRDPLGPEMGSDRVIRGGSWINFDQSCRSASRYAFAPGFRSDYLGFRVALVPSVN